jgi:hypothetical protein
MELLVSKLLLVQRNWSGYTGVQIVGTFRSHVSNLSDFERWLRVSRENVFIVSRTSNPSMSMYVGNWLYSNDHPGWRQPVDLDKHRLLISGPHARLNNVVCQSVALEFKQVLVYFPSVAECKAGAARIAQQIEVFKSATSANASGGGPLPTERDIRVAIGLQLSEWRRRALERLSALLQEVSELPDTDVSVQSGVACHHSAMTSEEKSLVENAFKNRALLVVCLTSDSQYAHRMSAPKIVIVFDDAMQVYDCAWFKRMTVQATEMAVIMASESNKHVVMDLFNTSPPPIVSQLAVEMRATQSNSAEFPIACRFLFDSLEYRYATTPRELEQLMRGTFYAATNTFIDWRSVMLSQAKRAVEMGYACAFDGVSVELASDTDLHCSPIGSACAISGVDICSAEYLFDELHSAQKGLQMSNEIYLLYVATSSLDFLDTLAFDIEKYVQLIDFYSTCVDSTLSAEAHRAISEFSRQHLGGRHKRMHAALLLHVMMNEESMEYLANVNGSSRGQMQSFKMRIVERLRMIGEFCHAFGWNTFGVAYMTLAARMRHGVRYDLLPLCSLIDFCEEPTVTTSQLRLIHSCGYTSIGGLATARQTELSNLFAHHIGSGHDSSAVCIVQPIGEFAKSVIEKARVLLSKKNGSCPPMAEQGTGELVSLMSQLVEGILV